MLVDAPESTSTSDLEFDEIKSRLALIRIDSLRLYENPNGHRVAEIAQSLDQTGKLIDPVIVDPSRRILIDGHHRVRAFKWFGLTRIPAFLVDYGSPEVSVRGWSRTTNAPTRIVEREFRNPSARQRGRWTVRADDGRGEMLARREFAEPRYGAQYLDHVVCRLEVSGFGATLCTESEAKRTGQVHIYTDPIVGKSEVMDIVAKGRVFPHEVNRHLIDRRPLELDVPVQAMTDDSRFRDFVDQLWDQRLPVLVASGYRQGSREYEERVILFRDRKESGE